MKDTPLNMDSWWNLKITQLKSGKIIWTKPPCMIFQGVMEIETQMIESMDLYVSIWWFLDSKKTNAEKKPPPKPTTTVACPGGLECDPVDWHSNIFACILHSWVDQNDPGR